MAVLLVLFGVGRRVPSSPAVLESPMPAPTVVDEHVAAEPRRPAARPPERNAEFDSSYEGLERRAAAGDSKAACRLTRILVDCRTTLSQDVMLEQLTAAIAPGIGYDRSKTGSAADPTAQLGAAIAKAQAYCGNLSTAQLDRAYRFLARAAELGDVTAQRTLVLNPPLDADRTLYDIDAWQHYAKTAPGYLERLARAGDFLAIETLAVGYAEAHVRTLPMSMVAMRNTNAPSGDSPRFASPFRVDNYRAALYRAAYARRATPEAWSEFERRYPDPASDLDAVDLSRAKADAARIPPAPHAYNDESARLVGTGRPDPPCNDAE
jgi:hypothetical protein